MKSYANYTPAKPSELPSYYVFGGWYKDKACTTKFDFNTEKMPNANVQIYAKWTAQKINLTYNLNTPDGTSKVVNSDVDAGTIASTVLPSASEIEGYSFAGWYYADGNGHMTTKVFNANDAITKDTSVIGKWLYNGELTVVYDPGTEGTKATVPTDSNIYAGGAKVTVAKNATTTSKKKFLGWKLNDNLYHPGDAFEVNKNLANEDNVITLTAVWGSEEHSTTMSYNPGNGRGDVKTVPVKNNESVTLKSEKDFDYQAREVEGKEYYFAGWATSMDDAYNGKATYAAGQSVHVDVDGENVLYATWIEKTVITVKAKSGTATYDGKEHKVEGFVATEFTVDGNKYTVEGLEASGATGTDVKEGNYPNTVTGKAVVKDAAGNNVTKQFTVKTENGSLVISKATVTLKSADLDKEYDGKALVNGEKALATETGWAEGEGATYKFTGSQTVVGSSANAFTYTLNEGTNADNYNITKTEGTLKVTPVTEKVTVTITGNIGSVKYDGNSHEVTGYTTSFSNALYTANDFEFNGTAEASRTNAGQKNMGLAVEQFTNTSDNFTNVEFVVTDGYSKVEKRKVTLTSADGSKVYDGNALTKNKVTESEDGFAEGEGATYDVTGFQTETGSSKNTFTYTLNEGTKAENYNITPVEGTLEVTPITNQVTVTITGHKDSTTYDGKEHTVSGYDVKTSNNLYTEANFTFGGIAEASRTNAGKTVMGLAAEQFTNTSANFSNVEFVVTDGYSKVEKRTVTLTSASDEKVYDGNALTNDTVTADGFVEGQGATYGVTGSQTDAGESKNTFTYTLNEGTNADNYEITKTEGTLKVTPVTDKVTVTITGNTDSVKYDGEEHAVTGYTTTFSNGLYTANDFEFSGTAEVNGKDADTYKMGLKKDQFKNTSKNFTNVEFVVTDGQLVIGKRTVTLTSGSDSKVYNGKPLTNGEVKVSGDGFAEGEGATYDVTGTITNVGETDNTFTYTLNKGTNPDNYEITKTEGKLIVTADASEVVVTITENSANITYDGNEHEATGYTTSITGGTDYKEGDFTFNGNASVKGTDAGTYNMELKPEDFQNTNDNYSKVKFIIVDGTLTISKRNVTLTSASDEKVYDGNALTNDTVTADGFVEGQGATYGVTGSQTDAGESKNTFTYTLNEGTNADNYEITKTEGTLKVTPVTDKVTVTITGNTSSVTYDGNSHQVSGYTTSFSNALYTANDFEFNGTAEASRTNAGKADMGLKKDQFKNTSKNFTNVEFVVTDGYSNVEKRTVTLTSASDEKVYDGNALTNDTVTAEGFVEGQGATYDVTGTITNVGEKANAFTYTLNKGTKADNYNITKTEGTLKVTPVTDKVTVTITGNTGSEKYDGNSHKVTGYTSAFSNELYTANDFEFSGIAEASRTDAGKTVMGLAAEQFTNTSANFTNVEFVVTDGYSKVNKRTVTLTSASDEKVYDGNALTKKKVTESEDGFAKGEGATYEFTGSQTNVGSSKNTFSYTLNEGTNADNYEITKAEGTLKVTPFTDKVTVTITGEKDTAVYDGKTHSVEGYKVTNISNALYKKADVQFNGTAKAEGTEVGTYTMKLTPAQFENKSRNFANVEFVVNDGKLEITPKSINPEDEKTGIKVTKPNDTMYNGEEQKNKPTVEDTKTGATLVENVDYTLSYTAAVNAGTVEVTITGKGNYTGTAKTSYEITKRDVLLTSATDSKVYDKKPLMNGKVTESGSGFVKDEGATYNVTGSQTKKGSSKNEFTYTLKSNTKASNYTIKVAYGDLTVTAEDGEVVVVITGHKKSFEYDGNEKSVKGYEVSITKGSTYEVSDFTFNGNDEVKGTEANTYPMGLKVSDFTNINDNYNKVKFVVTDGSLTITPKSITPDGPNTPEEKKTGITATDPEDSIYTGKAHVNPLTVRDTKTNKDLVENKDYTLTYSDDVVNVGTVTVTVKGIGNYTGEFTKTYKITPREYTVTTDSAKKTYDGTALTAGGHVNGLVEGETVSFKTTGSQTNEGTSDNTYELKFEGTAVETNYKHGKDSIGTLTVKKQSIDPGEDPEKPNPNYLGIEISNPSDEVYDGKEHKWSPTVVDKTGKELIVGTDYAVEYATSDFTNAGTINVTITGIGNYTGKVTRTYSITPREYTITTLDGTKVYDGKALTNFGLVDGIVYGETYSFKTTGSQTEVGTSDNTYEWKWNGTAKKSNYKLAKESIGKLTVKAKSIVPDGPDTPNEKKTGITVNEPSDSKYDGKEHKEVLTVTDTKTGKELVAGTDYSVTYSSDLVNAGTVKVTVAGLGNYSGSFTKTYKITKRSVTLTSATVSKVYDGQALTNTSITVSGDGFVKGEGATYSVTGTQTEVGNSANAFEYKLNEKTLASNYNITKVVGTLTITAAPAPVTPATPSTPSSTTSTTPRTPSAPQATTPAETVEKETTPKAEPKKEEKVEEEYTPKASPQYYWALINLICAILTVLFGLLLLISKRHKSEDDDDEEDDETKQQTNNDDEEKEQEKKRGLFTRVLAVLIAIVSVVFFLVTEDLSLPWTWTDQWTIWMVVIGLVQIVVFFVGRKWKNVDDDEDEEEAQQA